jgi:hypothetical protein
VIPFAKRKILLPRRGGCSATASEFPAAAAAEQDSPVLHRRTRRRNARLRKDVDALAK